MKQLRKIASLMCVVALMAMAVSLPTLAEETPGSAFAGGAGTAEDPWLIETAEQLNAVRNDLDASYALTADIDLSGYENWDPIGYFDVSAAENGDPYATGFAGTFDGRGHTVSNIVISNAEGVGVGLFGLTTSESVVSDLTVENVNSTGYMAAGGIIGYHCGTADKLTLKGENSVSAYNCAGGVAGGSEYGTFDNCMVEAVQINILGDNDFSSGRIIQVDMAQCGGLIVGGGFGGHVANCTATGEISAMGIEPIGLGGIGGCLEYMDYVENCAANVTISAPNSAHAVGGICGYSGTVDVQNPTYISGCTANFTMNIDGATHVGGICGTGLFIYGMESVFVIDDCTASGAMTGAITPGAIAGRAEGSTYEECSYDVTLDGATLGAELGVTDRMYESADQ